MIIFANIIIDTMPKKLILKKGDKFNYLTVISECKKRNHGNVVTLCKCDCGKIKKIQNRLLVNGITISCGCQRSIRLANRLKTHGLSKTETYLSWQSMKNRCYNKNNSEYKNYGERGIKVCDSWIKSFDNFINDMGIKPKKYTLERIDNDKDYNINNCKWETFKNQQRNKRTNHKLTFNDLTMTIVEWGEYLGIKPNTILTRIRRGWTVEKSLLKLANQ